MSSNKSGGVPCKGYLVPILRILGACTGGTVIALGVYDIVSGDQDVKSIVQNLYRIVFGILIILSELRLNSMLIWFSFLTYFPGLGGFYIFVGGLALGSRWWEITLAIAMCTIGILYIGMSCCCSEFAKDHHSVAKESQHHNDADVEKGASNQPYDKFNTPEQSKVKSNDDDDYNNNDRRGAYSSTQSAYGQRNKNAYGINDDSEDSRENPFANTSKKQRSAYG